MKKWQLFCVKTLLTAILITNNFFFEGTSAYLPRNYVIVVYYSWNRYQNAHEKKVGTSKVQRLNFTFTKTKPQSLLQISSWNNQTPQHTKFDVVQSFVQTLNTPKHRLLHFLVFPISLSVIVVCTRAIYGIFCIQVCVCVGQSWPMIYLQAHTYIHT